MKDMTHGSEHDSRKRILALLMAVGLLSAILTVATPQAAEAACDGVGTWNSYASHHPSTNPWGREDSRWDTTCDGEYDYYGKVQDAASDDHRVRIEARPDGYQFFSGLSSDAWVPYNYMDGDRDTWFGLCKVRVADGFTTDHGLWKRNWGF